MLNVRKQIAETMSSLTERRVGAGWCARAIAQLGVRERVMALHIYRFMEGRFNTVTVDSRSILPRPLEWWYSESEICSVIWLFTRLILKIEIKRPKQGLSSAHTHYPVNICISL